MPIELNLTEEEKERIRGYVSPWEKEKIAKFDTLDEIGLIKEFIRFLDAEEESDSGRVFRPTHISSCRVMDGWQIGQILTRLRSKLGIEE